MNKKRREREICTIEGDAICDEGCPITVCGHEDVVVE